MECPVCKETIEVPVRTRGQLPDSASFAASASKGETVFFQNETIMVTNARFVVGAKTFALSGITSVEVVEADEVVEQQPGDIKPLILTGLGLVSIVVGIICTMNGFGYGVLIVAGIIGVPILVGGALLSTQVKRAFKIVLKTASGEVTAYQSFDRAHISRINRALNDSIVSHG